MTLSIVNIIFAIVSAILCWKAPVGYNYDYCNMLMMLFLAQNACYFALDRKKNWLGFELFFAISFFFVNFVYPVFYYPTRPHFSFFAMKYPHDVITQATAIAYMGYAFYMLGITRIFRLDRKEPDEPVFKVEMNHYLWFFGITIVCFALFLLSGGWRALQAAYAGGGRLRDVGLYSYFNNLFTIACYLMAIFLFRLDKQKWWFYLIVILGCIMITLLTGSRQMALGIVLVLVVSFSMNIYHLKWWQVALIVTGGVLVLWFIVSVRKLGLDTNAWQAKLSRMNITNVLDLFEDLTINDINLFALVDFANRNELTWFHGMLLDITSPFPGVGSYILSHTYEPAEMLHGGDLPSLLLLGPNAGWGTGTNMVGEAFRSFGYTGTAISMFIIGFCVKETFYRAHKSIYCYLLYFLFVSHAVIYPRAPLLFDPRTIVWSLLLLCFVLEITKATPQIIQAVDKKLEDSRKEEAK